MKPSRYSNPFFIGHVAILVLDVPFILFLTATFMFHEWVHFRPLAMGLFLVGYLLSTVLIGVAFRRIGRSPLFALTAFVMGLIPLILYCVLPDKSSPSA
jgi:MFS family permease